MRYSSKGKIQNIIWLDALTTVKYSEIARRLNKASNVIMADILAKALEQACSICACPRLICQCQYITCKWCKKQFLKGQGFNETLCSKECAEQWWNSS